MTSSPVSRVVYNGKRPASNTRSPSSNEIFTPAHEENVRFIYEAWQCVERDLRNQVSGMDRGVVEEYVEKNPSNSLKCKNFQMIEGHKTQNSISLHYSITLVRARVGSTLNASGKFMV
ncbi:hypothetical protein XENTR_v10004003 [Xenopus tropicalis]|nr:hypothetical protein XENTR_v10004003 [Xenopus tropicalis]